MTVTAIPSQTPSPAISPCSAPITLGDASPHASNLESRNNLVTHVQRYTLASNATARKILLMIDNPAVVPISMRAALYDGTTYPDRQVLLSSVVMADDGVVEFDVPDTPLAAGIYWIAYCSYGEGYSVRSAVGSTSVRTYLPSEILPDPFIDFSATPVPTPPPLLTSGMGAMWVDLCDDGSVPPTGTPTPTFMGSPTSTPASCYVPRLKDTSPLTDTRPTTGGPVSILGYAKDAGVTVTAAFYDGSGARIAQFGVVSNASGYLSPLYTLQGTESFADVWHVQIFPAGTDAPAAYDAGAGFYDESVLYFNDPTPTPLPTVPCSNMVTQAAETSFFVPETHYLLGSCHTNHVRVYAALGENTLAWYDAADDLIASETQPNAFTQYFSYTFDGSGTPGTWHQTLFTSPATPASTWPGNAGGLCGPAALTVE